MLLKLEGKFIGKMWDIFFSFFLSEFSSLVFLETKLGLKGLIMRIPNKK